MVVRDRVDFTKGGIPAIMASPPTLGAAVAGGPASTITSAVLYPSVTTPGTDGGVPRVSAFYFGGGNWRQNTGFPNNLYALPTAPSTPNEGPNHAFIEFDYYGAKFEYGYKGQGNLTSRVWVDGVPAEAPYTDPGAQDGNFHLRPVTFGGAGLRRIRIEVYANGFYGVFAGPTDLVVPTGGYPEKLLYIGDSVGEGTGSTSNLDGIANSVARMLTFRELVNMSQGGTGLTVANGGLGRPKYAGRAGDWPLVGATAAIVQLSQNDNNVNTAGQLTELAVVLAALGVAGIRDVWVMGRAGYTASITTLVRAMEAVMGPVIEGWGVPFISLVNPVSLWTGSGGAESPTGSGTADVLFHNGGGNASHPTQAGHDAMARTFVSRLLPRLPGASTP